MDGGVGCPPVGLWVKRAGSEKLPEMGSLLGDLTAGGGNHFLCVRVGQLSHYSQVLRNGVGGGGDI